MLLYFFLPSYMWSKLGAAWGNYSAAFKLSKSSADLNVNSNYSVSYGTIVSQWYPQCHCAP